MRLPEEEFEVICMDEWQLEYLQEEVEGLAEDVVEIDERLSTTLDLMLQLSRCSADAVDVLGGLAEKVKELNAKQNAWETISSRLFGILYVAVVLLTLNAFNVI